MIEALKDTSRKSKLGFGQALRLQDLHYQARRDQLGEIAKLSVIVKYNPELLSNTATQKKIESVLRQAFNERDWNLVFLITFNLLESVRENHSLKLRGKGRNFLRKLEKLCLLSVERISSATKKGIQEARPLITRRLPDTLSRNYDDQVYALHTVFDSSLAIKFPRRVRSIVRETSANWLGIKNLLSPRV